MEAGFTFAITLVLFGVVAALSYMMGLKRGEDRKLEALRFAQSYGLMGGAHQGTSNPGAGPQALPSAALLQQAQALQVQKLQAMKTAYKKGFTGGGGGQAGSGGAGGYAPGAGSIGALLSNQPKKTP